MTTTDRWIVTWVGLVSGIGLEIAAWYCPLWPLKFFLALQGALLLWCVRLAYAP